jgi:hypothetical protein
VDEVEGERWFLGTHVPEVCRQNGLWRFFSYRAIKQPLPLPGTWPDHAPAPKSALRLGWDRVSELWYDNFADWKRAVLTEPPAYTRPAWASSATYPFLAPDRDFVSTFILERPNDEFLRDARSYL